MIGYSLLVSDPRLPNEAVEDHYTRNVLMEKFVVKCDKNRKYYVYESYEHFLKEASGDMFHEVNFGGPQRLKFDLDASAEKLAKISREFAVRKADLYLEESVEKYVRDCYKTVSTPAEITEAFVNTVAYTIGAIRDAFFCIYSEELSLSDIIICDSSGFKSPVDTDPKMSAHIIVDRAVSSNQQAQEFLIRTRPLLSSIFWPVIDSGVYKSVQNFRLVDQKKPDGRVKKILSNHPREKTTVAPSADTVLMPDILAERKNTISIDLAKEDVNSVVELLKSEGLLVAHSFRKNVNGLFLFTRNCSSKCDICTEAVREGIIDCPLDPDGNVVHDKDATLLVFVYYDVGDKISVYRKCRHESEDAKMSGRKCRNKLVGSVPASRPGLATVTHSEEKSSQKWAEKMIDRAISTRFLSGTKFDVASEKITKNCYSEATLMQFEVAKTLVVHAPMKIGKTKKLREYINENFPAGRLRPPRIVFLSFRQTFSRNIKENFSDFVLYSEVKGPLVQDRIIVQVESLHRLSVVAGQQKPDLLILDECESIIEQFGSGLLRGNFSDCFAKFQYLMKFSEKVICMDAMITDRTYNVIETMRGIDGLVYHKNSYQNAADYTYQFYADKGVWLSSLFAAISAGEHVAVPSSSLTESKALMEAINRKFPHKCVGLYSSETTFATRREHFGDVNKHWSIYDVLIYTPTVSAGVSFETKHFSKVFCLFTDQSCNAETCMQMIGRIRDVADKQVHVFLGLQGANLPDTREAIISQLYDCRAKINNSMGDFSAAVTIGYGEDGTKFVHETPYFTVWVENLLSRNRSRNAFASRLIPYVKSTGAKCILVTSSESTCEKISPEKLLGVSAEEVDEKKSTLNSEVAVAKKRVSERENRAVAESAELTDEAADELISLRHQQIDITRDQTLSLEKYRLRRAYCFRGPITAVFVATYKSPAVIRAFKNISRLTALLSEVDQTLELPEKITAALDLLRVSESAAHEYLMTNSRHHDDLNRKYVYKQHLLANWLVSAVGWKSIYDKTYLNVGVAEIIIEPNRKEIQRTVLQAAHEFDVKLPRHSDGVAGILKFVGTVLKIMYLIKVVMCPRDKKTYKLEWPKEFSDKWESESAGIVCYLPEATRPRPEPEKHEEEAVENDLDWLLDGL